MIYPAIIPTGLSRQDRAFSLTGDAPSSRAFDSSTQSWRTTVGQAPQATYVPWISLMVGMIFH